MFVTVLGIKSHLQNKGQNMTPFHQRKTGREQAEAELCVTRVGWWRGRNRPDRLPPCENRVRQPMVPRWWSREVAPKLLQSYYLPQGRSPQNENLLAQDTPAMQGQWWRRHLVPLFLHLKDNATCILVLNSSRIEYALFLFSSPRLENLDLSPSLPFSLV